MENKYKIVVTEEHKKSGIFPWHNSVGTEYTLFLDCPSLNIVILFSFRLESLSGCECVDARTEISRRSDSNRKGNGHIH